MKKNISNALKTTTTNYKLIKPGHDDFYNIDEFNQNMDIIDQNMKDNLNKINDLSDEKAPKNNAKFIGTMTLNGNNVAITDRTEILFNGDFLISGTQTVTLSKSIIQYNRLYINVGRGGEKTWCEVIVNSSYMPNNFRVGDIITLVVPNNSYQAVCASLKVLSETQLQAIGGDSVRLRNVKGVLTC